MQGLSRKYLQITSQTMQESCRNLARLMTRSHKKTNTRALKDHWSSYKSFPVGMQIMDIQPVLNYMLMWSYVCMHVLVWIATPHGQQALASANLWCTTDVKCIWYGWYVVDSRGSTTSWHGLQFRRRIRSITSWQLESTISTQSHHVCTLTDVELCAMHVTRRLRSNTSWPYLAFIDCCTLRVGF